MSVYRHGDVTPLSNFPKMANATETHHEQESHYLGKAYENGLKEISNVHSKTQDTDTMQLRE